MQPTNNVLRLKSFIFFSKIFFTAQNNAVELCLRVLWIEKVIDPKKKIFEQIFLKALDNDTDQFHKAREREGGRQCTRGRKVAISYSSKNFSLNSFSNATQLNCACACFCGLRMLQKKRLSRGKNILRIFVFFYEEAAVPTP